MLGLTGLAAAFLILGAHPFRDPLAMAGHPYGRFLGGKVLLFFGMLALAGVNRFVFLGRRPGPDSAAPGTGPEVTAPSDVPGTRSRTGPFARVVALEAALGVAVLVLAGFLTAMSPPGGAYEEDAPAAFTAFGTSENYDVVLGATPSPTAGASSNVSLVIRTSDGSPLTEAVRVRVEIRPEDGNGSEYSATHSRGGTWRLGDVFFATGGAYVALVTIQTEEIFREVVEVRFDVA